MAPRLDRLAPGTRLRLFHVDGGDRVATSGTLLSMTPGSLRMTSDEGGEVTVRLSDVTCFYVPKPLDRGSALARTMRFVRRLFGGRGAGTHEPARAVRRFPEQSGDELGEPAEAEELADSLV